ncbi:MAG TPA: BTAD domain-containing putative transcriptional regulator [Acidimicrobiia bacterium]
MEFRLLGPVEVVADGKPLPLGGRQRRTVLAILLANAPDPVSTDRLIEEIWGGDPPGAARKGVQAHIAHLRRTLNTHEEVLTPAVDGYALDVGDGSVDARQFEDLVVEARPQIVSDPDRAMDLLGRALGLFRGSPFSGLADDAISLRVEASRLDQLRLSAVEDRLEAMLAAGEYGQLQTEAARLVEQHPLRERMWALLMLGLYRGGRQSEALGAYSRVRQILAEELGIEPSSELQTLEQRILEHDPTLTQSAPLEVVSTPAVFPTVRNPYKGLRAFDETDAADFFGREDLVRRLHERLERREAVTGLVVLAGPSGAGKSSAVRAGLVPRLREEGFDLAVMFPGSDPMGEQARAVAEATGESSQQVVRRLEESGRLTEGPLIVVVDQFEELFTLANSDDMERFLEIVTADNSLVRWLITVRADFLDRMLTYPALGPRLDGAVVLVPPMQDHEVKAAVTGPAGRVGVSVEPELVSELIKDVRTRPGSLPLLQYALTDTFERGNKHLLTLADYHSAGGISGALSRRADELFESLDRDRQEAMKQVLLALVAVTEDGENLRRRVDREALMSLPSATESISTVIERLATQRLLTFDQSPETGRATVEVAHEAFITEWPRFAGWVDASREDLRLRQRISTAAREWEESGKDTGFLLTGSRLEQFSEWVRATDLELTALDEEYLGSSLAAEEARVRRARRSRRLVVGGVAAGVLIATALGAFALSQRRATTEQERIVAVGELAAAATDNLAIDSDLSILLAIQAVETTRRADRSVLGVAEEALHRAVLSHRVLGRVHHDGPGIAHLSPDGSHFVTSSLDPISVEVWSVEPFQRQLTLVGHTDIVIDAVFDPSGARLATAGLDGTVRIWDGQIGELELTLDSGGSPLLIPVFSNDGSMVAATSLEGTTRIWDLETLAVKVLPPAEEALTLNLEFSPDDSLLAVTRQTEFGVPDYAAIYDVNTGEIVRRLESELAITDLGFTPDGGRIVTADGEARTATIWDIETGEKIAVYFGHEGPIQDLQVSQDGTTVASSGFVDVKVWDLNTRETLATIAGHRGLVDGIDINLNRGLLLTSSETDKTTRLWDLTSHWSHELVGMPGPTYLGAVTYSSDGDLLAASRGGDKVTIWNPDTGQEVKTFHDLGFTLRMEMDAEESVLVTAGALGVNVNDLRREQNPNSLVDGWSNGVALGPGGMVATASDDGIRLWDSLSGGEPELVSGARTSIVAFGPTGELLAYGVEESDDRNHVEIREVETAELVATLKEHTGVIRGLAFDREGEYLATASGDTTAIIWDANTFELIHRLEAHTSDVFDIAFDPTRPEVATAGGDNSIRLWSVENGSLRLTLPAQAAISDLAYSPDGRYLAAVSPEGFVTVYMLDVDELLDEAEARLTRWWTEAECKQYLELEACLPPPENLSS